MLNCQFKYYNDLSLNEFHDLIALRIKVFVVEQNCPYQELDGKDKKAYHLIGRNGKGDLIATMRILPEGVAHKNVSIGRILLEKNLRGNEYGHQMVREALEFCVAEFGTVPISMEAQKHLEHFYGEHGFQSTGKEFMLDGIPHIELTREP